MTFEYDASGCTAFCVTADPWADTARITGLCREKDVPLYVYPDANHSLETGDPLRDIEYLSRVMRITDGLLDQKN